MFVSMVAGAVFVVIFGIIMMLVLYAGNLDTLLMVSPAVTDICCIAFLLLFFKVRWGRLQYMFHPLLLLIISLILTALVMSLVYLSVPLMVWLVIILVLTQGMLMLIVKV